MPGILSVPCIGFLLLRGHITEILASLAGSFSPNTSSLLSEAAAADDAQEAQMRQCFSECFDREVSLNRNAVFLSS